MLDGDGKVIIDVGGWGIVFIVKVDCVILCGLMLCNSGDLYDQIDGGLMVEGCELLIENNIIEDVLFGILFYKINDSIVCCNCICFCFVVLVDCGDGMCLWYSIDNCIEQNDIVQICDIMVSNVLCNCFIGNIVRDSWWVFNLFFVYCSLVEGNCFENNLIGVVVFNLDGLIICCNLIIYVMDLVGVGIVLKEILVVLIDGNEIVYCVYGIMIDLFMYLINWMIFVNNLIVYNVIGIYFYGVRGSYIVIDNIFCSNLWLVSVVGEGDLMNDFWQGNSWDVYEGFD